MIKKVFTALSALYVLVYLISCLTPYINPKQFPFFILLGLGFPILLGGLILLEIIWLFINKKIALLFFILMFVGWQNIFSTFTFHLPQNFIVQKDSSSLRIMSWNVKSFDNCSIGADPDIRSQIFKTIDSVKADIICIQDFIEFYNLKAFYSNLQWLDSLGYKYQYSTRDIFLNPYYGSSHSGIAIVSKIPLLDSGKVYYSNSVFPESFCFVDIVWQRKKIRLFSTHLQSMFINSDSNAPMPNLYPTLEDSIFIMDASAKEKLQHYDSIHATQALLTKKIINQSPYPIILCGDFNSTPTNYAYHVLSQGLQDAFLKKGIGIGGTYDGKSPTIRIDYILPSKQFVVKQYYSPKLKLSDHFPVITDIKWKD